MPILESLGFSTPPVPRRRTRSVAPAEPPVATAVSTAVPTRSTTALIEELWETTKVRGEFPPPVAPAIALPVRRVGWPSLIIILVLGLVGAYGAHVGTGLLLDARNADQIEAASVALDNARAGALAAIDAAEAIADPDATTVALSDATTAISSLEEDARVLRGVTSPDDDWLTVLGISGPDPLAGRRSAYFGAAATGRGVADDLSAVLTTRLLVEQLPPLPILPDGADDPTIDALAVDLAGTVALLRSDLGRIDEDLSASLGPLVAEWETASLAYIGLLRSHDPDAAELATDVAGGYRAIGEAADAWLAAAGQRLAASTAAYLAALDSIG